MLEKVMENGEKKQAGQAKLYNLRIDKYKGLSSSSDDAVEWLATFNQTCKAYGLSDTDKAIAFPIYLVQLAKQWFMALSEQVKDSWTISTPTQRAASRDSDIQFNNRSNAQQFNTQPTSPMPNLTRHSTDDEKELSDGEKLQRALAEIEEMKERQRKRNMTSFMEGASC